VARLDSRECECRVGVTITLLIGEWTGFVRFANHTSAIVPVIDLERNVQREREDTSVENCGFRLSF
jgi:hypothetical protein